MKVPARIAALTILSLTFPYSSTREDVTAADDAAGPGLEREISINIHSGITTFPIRKVIGMVIAKAEEKDVETITANAARHGDATWDLTLILLGKEEKVKKSLKWRYERDKGVITPLNEGAKSVSSPLSNFLFKVAINKGFGMLKAEGVSPKKVDGRAERLSEGNWQFNLAGLSDNGERFTQKWSYNSKEGVLSPAQLPRPDTERALAAATVEN
ncbi:MAG: hypothetical protein V3V45_00280 [Candidatus Brocadiales bacterium]